MSRFTDILDRLPSLYRPEPDDTELFTNFIRSVATELDEVNTRATEVLQSHWSGYADRALYDRFFLRTRELAGLPQPGANDPELAEFPYLHDLAYLAGLLSIKPWENEPVEEFRTRVRTIVNVYKNGLGTLGAIRSITEAYMGASRPFWLEEFPSRSGGIQQAATRGAPEGVLGPLMCWNIKNTDTRHAGLMTFYIQGETPEPGKKEATINPAIELYKAESGMPRLAIAYQGTLAPQETLRLRPAYSSWLGGPAGIARSTARPGESTPADPSAPGPWTMLTDGPTQPVTALAQTCEGTLWAASDTTLWSFDGRNWNEVLTGLVQIHTLLADGSRLLIGTDENLLSLELNSSAPLTLLHERCHTLYADGDDIWLGTNGGAGRLTFSEASATREDFLPGLPVYAVHRDNTGLFFGTSLGVFRYQQGAGRWFYYTGGGHTEQVEDWKAYDPATDSLPVESQVFLPGVRCIARGPDSTLWLGTDSGMARYLARSVDGLTYETVCESFADLCRGPVHDITVDERGLAWFATDRGLFRYDGSCFWHYSGNAWKHLGKAENLYCAGDEKRGSWRYLRLTSSWERYAPGANNWTRHTDACVTTDESPVFAFCWTDAVSADTGEWDGQNFTPKAVVDPAMLCMRYKPDEEHIIAGGIPSVPRLPLGTSVWRYLRLEEETLPVPARTPYWSWEGRLIETLAHVVEETAIPMLKPLTDFHKTAPLEGRYGGRRRSVFSHFDTSVFAYPPAAKIWYTAGTRPIPGVCVRLKKINATENIDPLALKRVAAAIRQVRPAGVPVELFVEEEKFLEESHG